MTRNLNDVYYRPHPKDGGRYCFQFVCQFTSWGRGGGATPVRSGGGAPHPRSGPGGGGTPSQVWPGGVPYPRSGWGGYRGSPQPGQEGVPWPDQTWDGVPPLGPGTGYPPGSGMGYPPWHSEHLLRGGRYASCVHAGGLSCVLSWFWCKIKSVLKCELGWKCVCVWKALSTIVVASRALIAKRHNGNIRSLYFVFQIHDMQVTINDTIDKRLQELKLMWRRHNKLNRTLKQELRELTDFALKNTSKILTSVNGINKKAENVDMSHAIHNAWEYGYWRFASYYISRFIDKNNKQKSWIF